MRIEALREEINAIDERIVSLFCERMSVAARVAEYKKEKGLPVLDEKREAELYARVAALAEEPFAEDTKKLYEKITELSRAYQSRVLSK